MASGCGLSWRGGGCVGGSGDDSWLGVDVGLAMLTMTAAATAKGPPAATETISAAAGAASELAVPVGVVPLVPNVGFAMNEEPDDESHHNQTRHHDGCYLPARQWGVIAGNSEEEWAASIANWATWHTVTEAAGTLITHDVWVPDWLQSAIQSLQLILG